MTDIDRGAQETPEREAFEHDPYGRGPYDIEADGVRRLVIDSEHEEALQARHAGGRQAVIQPPVGTVGGPPAAAADGGSTDEVHSIPSGGGPADPARMPER